MTPHRTPVKCGGKTEDPSTLTGVFDRTGGGSSVLGQAVPVGLDSGPKFLL